MWIAVFEKALFGTAGCGKNGCPEDGDFILNVMIPCRASQNAC